jgi:hypothetical protein
MFQTSMNVTSIRHKDEARDAVEDALLVVEGLKEAVGEVAATGG